MGAFGSEHRFAACRVFAAVAQAQQYAVIGFGAYANAQRIGKGGAFEITCADFGNGRYVRNLFEDMVVRHSNRVAQMEAPTRDDLMTFLPEDIDEEAAEGENEDAE